MKYLKLFILISVLFLACTRSEKPEESSEQEAISAILNRIQLPEIPDATFHLLDFGTVDQLREDMKPAINSAIRACADAGGGKVVIPPGEYFCKGPIHLLSHVNLHLEEGATVVFSQNPSDYLPMVQVRWEGVECYNYSPYIYAWKQHDIAVTGKGRFDGNASGGIFEWRYKQKPSQNLMREMGREGVPLEDRVFGEGHFIRMSFFQPMFCERVLVSNVSIENVPFWVIHPTYCKSVTVKGIRVNSRNINNDGVDPDSSEDVLIEDCWFNTGDDAIAVKSGRDQDAWRIGRPSKNIVVRNCHAENTLHGIAIGSEMGAGVEHVYVQNFSMKKVDKYALQFKSNKDRGGYIRNIWIDGLEIDSTGTAIFFTNDYHSYSGGSYPSEFHHIDLKNITCQYASGMGIDMSGLPEQAISDVYFEKVLVEKAEEFAHAIHTQNIGFREVSINDCEITSVENLQKPAR
jgi:polygalacturonase